MREWLAGDGARIGSVALGLICLAFVLLASGNEHRAAVGAYPIEPSVDLTGWGQDHVGRPLPEFMSGDECLFCHRDIGADWNRNRHQQALRPVDDRSDAFKLLAGHDPQRASETRYVLGSQQHVRFLKRGRKYGTLQLLTAMWESRDDESKIVGPVPATWDDARFAAECSGCHTSGVDAHSGAFSTLSLDCFVCHGDVSLTHTKGEAKVLLASDVQDDARVVISICGQCHLRGGRSRSSHRPYPASYVAGDNLFRDFEVELSSQRIAMITSSDQHIFENVREVMVHGKHAITCLSCHEIHQQSTAKHQSLVTTSICQTCHTDTDEAWSVREFTNASEVCDLPKVAIP